MPFTGSIRTGREEGMVCGGTGQGRLGNGCGGGGENFHGRGRGKEGFSGNRGLFLRGGGFGMDLGLFFARGVGVFCNKYRLWIM